MEFDKLGGNFERSWQHVKKFCSKRKKSQKQQFKGYKIKKEKNSAQNLIALSLNLIYPELYLKVTFDILDWKLSFKKFLNYVNEVINQNIIFYFM